MPAFEQGGEFKVPKGLNEYYPDIPIADQVIWPMINLVKGVKSWRDQSHEGEYPTLIEEFDYLDDQRIDVMLSATRYDFVDNGEPTTSHIASLKLTEYLGQPDDTDEARHQYRQEVLNGAKAYAVERYGSLDFAAGDNDEPIWPAGVEDEFAVCTEQTYTFDDTGLVEKSFMRTIKGMDRVVRYAFDGHPEQINNYDSNRGIERNNRIFAAHFNSIFVACQVLDPPADIINSLNHLRQHPAEIIG